MNCMKCGSETSADAVFCDECLRRMEQYPVSPNTLVYVPSEKDRAAVKRHSPAPLIITAEDQVKKLNRRLHVMGLLLALSLGATIFFGLLSLDTIRELNMTNFVGKNYTAITSSATVD